MIGSFLDLMRLLALLILTATSLYAGNPPSDSQQGSTLRDLVLRDLRRPFATDAEMSQRFTDHRKEFEQLVTMAKADKELVRIAPDFTWTTTSVAWPRPDSELG